MAHVFDINDAKEAASLRRVNAAREANHRIANNLSLLTAALHVQGKGIKKGAALYTAEDVQGILDEVGVRLGAITNLHQMLSRDVGENTIDIGRYLRTVCDSLTKAFERKAHISCELASIEVSPERAAAIALIVTELVTNAIKYAHPTGIEGLIEVNCRAKPTGALVIEVTDDGVGLPENYDPKDASTVGFELIRALGTSIGASLSFRDEGLGLTVRLDIPA